MRVLITGGAGFVGSFLADALARAGMHVRIFDSFDEQVHADAPAKLREVVSKHPDTIRGDVRNIDQLRAALNGVDAVVHFAAQVGVGQSMYAVTRDVDQNMAGTGVLLQLIAEFNVGTGRATSVLQLAELLAAKLGHSGPIDIRHAFREGDIRHCVADIGSIQKRLGFVPQVRLEDGIDDLFVWARTQTAVDRFESAAAELSSRRLTR